MLDTNTKHISNMKQKTLKQPKVPAHELARAVKWDEQMKYERGELIVDGPSYEAYIREWMKPFGEVPHFDKGNPGVEVGKMHFCYRTLPTHHPRRAHFLSDMVFMQRATLSINRRNRTIGQVKFTTPVPIPILHQMGQVWMSITPSEVFSLRTALRHCRGRVLIGGMGMGWVARKVAELPKVKSVTVVDKDGGVLDYFGKAVKCERVCDDAFTFAYNNVKQFDSIVFDVWPGYGDAREDERWLGVKAKAQAFGVSAWAWD